MKKKTNKKKETKQIIFLSVVIVLVLALIATVSIGYYNKSTYEISNL